MRGFILIGVLLLAGCVGDVNNGPTKGDGWFAVAEAYCIALHERCGPPGDVDQCTRHNIHHLCELDRSCSHVVSFEELDVYYTCAEATMVADCTLISWRLLPDEECSPLF